MERSWSDLPEELLDDIAGRFNTDIDEGLNTGFFNGNRFRSVCSSWRRSSNVPYFHRTSPLSSIELPFKISDFTDSGSTVYRLEPSTNHSAGWLVKIKNKSPNKLRLLIPPQVQNLPKGDGNRNKKYLVECGGDLLLVYRYDGLCVGEVKSFQVYKLKDDGHNWVAVENLGDQMLFLNISCSFSASAKDFDGCKGNSIYFQRWSMAQGLAVKNKYCGVFDLKSGQVSELKHRLPTWVKS